MSHDDGRFNSLIIDSSVETRRRLQQIMTSVNEFKKVEHVTSIEGAKGFLLDKVSDVIFISYRFSDEEVEGFIETAKTLRGGTDSAYVFVLKDEDQDGTRAAQAMLMGADGLLFEPYSVDRLVEITKLAAKLKLERGEARERAALELILNEAMGTLDLLAALKADGIEPTSIVKQFKRSCEPLENLGNGRLATYYSTAVSSFENAKIPESLPSRHRYKGASSRVKTKVQDFLINKLQDELKAEK